MAKLFERLLIGSVGLVLAGCAATSKPVAPPDGELIRYVTGSGGPFCGTCDSLELLVGSDGGVTIRESHAVTVHESYLSGSQTRWITRTRHAKITPDAYRSFRERLQPYRRSELVGDSSGCDPYLSDSSDLQIRWIGGGREDWLVYDLGCVRPGPEAMDLRTAPTLLGLRGLKNPLDPS